MKITIHLAVLGEWSIIFFFKDQEGKIKLYTAVFPGIYDLIPPNQINMVHIVI